MLGLFQNILGEALVVGNKYRDKLIITTISYEGNPILLSADSTLEDNV
jgi:hypothetical protein